MKKKDKKNIVIMLGETNLTEHPRRAVEDSAFFTMSGAICFMETPRNLHDSYYRKNPKNMVMVCWTLRG